MSKPRVTYRPRIAPAAVLLTVLLFFGSGSAHADRRYFVRSYTPYLAPAGELELETWLTARSGRQDSTVHTAWNQRVEFEYAQTDRLTLAGLLNFTQEPGGSLTFVSPAIEVIYGLAERGRVFGDPAFYTEVSESGEEMEIENKLLLAHRSGRLVSAVNLISEIEIRHNDEEKLPTGETLSNHFSGEITGGVAYEVSPMVAIALEGRYRTEHPNFGSQAAAIFSLGPTVNFQSGKVQLAIGSLVQVWGNPHTRGRRNLEDFEKMQVRAILGIEL